MSPPDRDLVAFRDHCRQHSQPDDADPLWAQLADEVDRWLTDSQNGQHPPEGQDTLI